MLHFEDLGKNIIEMEYAVRGAIVLRAQELERQGREIVYCNIGNPHALKQKPLTYVRQVLALCELPELIEQVSLFPADVRQVAETVLKESRHGVGAYSESAGLAFIREAVAKFIQNRDGIPASKDDIYLTDGASKGAQSILRMLIAKETDGIMIPIPQYPLYSATITFFGARQVGYYLDEKNNWKLNQELLEKSFQEATKNGTRVRGIVVINPGNPTGSVLDAENINMILDFAHKYKISIIADEVYQDNIYLPEDKFVSFAKALSQKGIKDVSLFSLHSCSKGYLGECGHRGGYLECRNLNKDVAEQLLKLQSVSLCANLLGQVMTYLMVSPPPPGSPSHDLYIKEKTDILERLKRKAKLLAHGLNKIPGVQSNVVAGAMYAFPCVQIPKDMTDTEYCMKLLEETGICVVPGSGFGQREGTAHFRTTILPPTEKMEYFLKALKEFQAKIN